MKIAILYSGHIRTWGHCKINHNDTILYSNPDLYFYTYSEPIDTNYKLFVKIPCEYYKLNPDHKFNSNRRPESEPHNSFNQWHNNFVGFNLIPNDYDVYVRGRCDIVLSSKILFEDYVYDDNTIYIPTGNDFWGINDQFAFGSYEALKKYFNVYVNKDEIFSNGIQYNPEVYILENLKMQNMNIIRIPQTNKIIK